VVIVTEREAFVAAEIARIAREELKVEEAPAPGDSLAAKLDSMMLLALVVAVEDRFHVILTDEDAAGTHTLEDLARLVASRAPEERLLAAARPGASP
jgi:acyl carrier protein